LKGPKDSETAFIRAGKARKRRKRINTSIADARNKLLEIKYVQDLNYWQSLLLQRLVLRIGKKRWLRFYTLDTKVAFCICIPT
jgi:hypothetical protein